MTKLERRLENAKANMKSATTASQVVKYMNEVARLERAVRNEANAVLTKAQQEAFDQGVQDGRRSWSGSNPYTYSTLMSFYTKGFEAGSQHRAA